MNRNFNHGGRTRKNQLNRDYNKKSHGAKERKNRRRKRGREKEKGMMREKRSKDHYYHQQLWDVRKTPGYP